MTLSSSISSSTSARVSSQGAGVWSAPLIHGTEGLAGLEHGVAAKARAFFAGGGKSTGLDTLVVTWQ